MPAKIIDTKLLCKMIIGGANNLNANKEKINELNVFPVPDGDTGTNMCMTIFSAVQEIGKIKDPNMEDLSKALSSGSLRGARGNSGVILSQLIRGFAKAIAHHKRMDKRVLCEALSRACETAYKAVMKPKEGTILTIARAASDKALELVRDDSCSLEGLLDAIIEEAERVLALTPDMLPVLKQAGVVDAGGVGLIEIFKGARDAYLGKEVDYNIPDLTVAKDRPKPAAEFATEDITFGYCTEFIINLEKSFTDSDQSEYRTFLNSIGDSIVLVADDEIVKTHVHTNDPGLVLQRALGMGSLTSIKIDNMRQQHQELLFKDTENLAKEQAGEQADAAKTPDGTDDHSESDLPEKDVGFIAVSAGDGMNNVFLELGADHIIEGGQTMNPSTEDLLNAINRVNARSVFIFPNNKNIILAANQAASMATDKEVVVIPTTTLPQGITALINFVPESDIAANQDLMTGVLSMVKTGEVTYAIRDTVFDDMEIKKGDYMGIGDSSILSAGKDLETVVTDMVGKMVDEESSFICIYYGEDIEKEDAENLGARLSEEHPECEVETQYGGQPIYYYIVSVE